MRWFVCIPLIFMSLIALPGCDDGTSDPDLGGDRDASPQSCRLNSDCPPGLFCDDGVCDFECRARRDCAAGEICESGQCVGLVDMQSGRDQAVDAAPLDATLPDAAPDAEPADAALLSCTQTGCPAYSTARHMKR